LKQYLINGVFYVPILVLFVFTIVLDQVTKFYIQGSMFMGMSQPVIPGIFHITYILNPGAAFGILENQRLFFIFVAVAILVVAAYFYSRLLKEPLLLRYGAGLLLGGAVGNLIDRIRIGAVVDFFDFRVWPIFNFADIAIVIGVGLVIYSVFLQTKDD
jgi:signal peptidase II